MPIRLYQAPAAVCLCPMTAYVRSYVSALHTEKSHNYTTLFFPSAFSVKSSGVCPDVQALIGPYLPHWPLG